MACSKHRVQNGQPNEAIVRNDFPHASLEAEHDPLTVRELRECPKYLVAHERGLGPKWRESDPNWEWGHGYSISGGILLECDEPSHRLTLCS